MGAFLASLFGIDIPNTTKNIQKSNNTISIEKNVDTDKGKKFDNIDFIPDENDLTKNHPKNIPERTFIIYMQ